MPRPHFTLTVVTSRDGFIARHPGDSPATWASAEEQALFFADVEAADWGILGRHTHQLADRPDRRRIVLSTAAGTGDWRRPTQLWLDPRAVTPADLPGHVGAVRPLAHGVILGGTRVHDWFLHHGAIDRVHLSVEPLDFGTGLPLFSDRQGPPAAVLADLGFACTSDRPLNAAGTRHSIWTPRGA